MTSFLFIFSGSCLLMNFSTYFFAGHSNSWIYRIRFRHYLLFSWIKCQMISPIKERGQRALPK
jgi:hypothetical protein